MDCDCRVQGHAIVRIAQERGFAILRNTTLFLLMAISIACSVSVSFETTVYCSTQALLETVESAFYKGEAGGQSQEFQKNVKNLQMSKKFLSLSENIFICNLNTNEMKQSKKMQSTRPAPKCRKFNFDLPVTVECKGTR